MKTHFTYDEARADAKPGDEIWARTSHGGSDGWAVMSTDQANEYIRTTPSCPREWCHWETVK